MTAKVAHGFAEMSGSGLGGGGGGGGDGRGLGKAALCTCYWAHQIFTGNLEYHERRPLQRITSENRPGPLSIRAS